MIIVTKETSVVIDIIDTIDINKWSISESYQTSHYKLLTNRNGSLVEWSRLAELWMLTLAGRLLYGKIGYETFFGKKIKS